MYRTIKYMKKKYRTKKPDVVLKKPNETQRDQYRKKLKKFTNKLN